MALDPVRNFAKVEVSTGYDDSATSIDLASGEAAKLPDPATDGAFNVVWYDSENFASPEEDPNVEIIRVTAISGDTLTVTRAQESTTASTKNTAGATYKMINAPTQKMIEDIQEEIDGAGTEAFTDLGEISTNDTIDASTGSNFIATLTADTVDLTLSNVVDGQKLNLIFENYALNTYEVDTATYEKQIATQDYHTFGIAWNNNGTKFYEAEWNNDLIYESNVTTPFDLATASFSKSIAGVSNMRAISWNNDGTKMYIVANSIREYTLTTAFDISTATFSQSISIPGAGSTGIDWNNDGTKMYIISNGTDKIYQYTLTTAFDISTASIEKNINTRDNIPTDFFMASDGTKMFELRADTGVGVDQYTLSTPFDIATATYEKSLPLSTRDNSPDAMTFNNNGTKFYFAGDENYKIYQYSIGTLNFKIPNSITGVEYISGEALPASATNTNKSIVEIQKAGDTLIGSYKELV